MVSCAELIQKLGEFKSNKASEFKLAPIEKWMIEKLGVRRLPNPTGSMVRYQHPSIGRLRGSSIFGIHRQHRGKREIVSRRDFRTYLCPRLEDIIQFMIQEGECEK